ncbi:MAG: adenylosuccinate synthase [Sphaerochaetaceae bacterium]
MSITSVIGVQSGDEGKGRIVDYLAQQSDVVIRYQGGDNAGHTVINEKGKFALHIIPSGIFNPKTVNIVDAGAVVNFTTMEEELKNLEEKKVDTKNLFIDTRAHLIMPYHCALDGAEENKRSSHEKIGTTKRGIGPCYSDKAARNGLRAGDLLDPSWLKMRLEMVLPLKNRELDYYGLPEYKLEELLELCASWSEKFGNRIKDTLPLLRDAYKEHKHILMEGQLGIMRDLDWGIYPYTTSSNPTSGGACTGAGIAPNRIDTIIGVAKAYSTCVGGGPYPTELFDEDGDRLRKIGGEFGATTGRPRRTGWFDAVAADFAAWVNGFTGIALTKLDVLDSFEKIKVCVAYELDGKRTTYLPDTKGQERSKPIYEEYEGWMCPTTSARKWEDLPDKAKKFVTRLEELVGCPIKYISVGPERDQIIIR